MKIKLRRRGLLLSVALSAVVLAAVLAPTAAATAPVTETFTLSGAFDDLQPSVVSQ